MNIPNDDLPTTKQLKKLLKLRLRYDQLEAETLHPIREWKRKFRRSVFYLYPNGAAPLTALMDLIPND